MQAPETKVVVPTKKLILSKPANVKKEPVVVATKRVILSKPTNNTTNVKKERVGEEIKIKSLEEIQREKALNSLIRNRALKAEQNKQGQNSKKEENVITESEPVRRRIILGKILALSFKLSC